MKSVGINKHMLTNGIRGNRKFNQYSIEYHDALNVINVVYVVPQSVLYGFQRFVLVRNQRSDIYFALFNQAKRAHVSGRFPISLESSGRAYGS
jgi:hypothetical protein